MANFMGRPETSTKMVFADRFLKKNNYTQPTASEDPMLQARLLAYKLSFFIQGSNEFRLRKWVIFSLLFLSCSINKYVTFYTCQKFFFLAESSGNPRLVGQLTRGMLKRCWQIS